MLLERKSLVKVDLAELEEEKQNIVKFLNSQFKLNATANWEGFEFGDEEVSSQMLARLINKYIYRKNLNRTYWVTVDSDKVKIKKFQAIKKEKKNKHPYTAATIRTGW